MVSVVSRESVQDKDNVARDVALKTLALTPQFGELAAKCVFSGPWGNVLKLVADEVERVKRDITAGDGQKACLAVVLVHMAEENMIKTLENIEGFQNGDSASQLIYYLYMAFNSDSYKRFKLHASENFQDSPEFKRFKAAWWDNQYL